MGRRDLGVALVGLVVLVGVAFGAAKVGALAGEPDPVTQPAIRVETQAEPPVAGGLYGFETLGRSLTLGAWGTVVSAEPAMVPVEVEVEVDGEVEIQVQEVAGFRVTLDQDGVEVVLELPADDRVRILAPGELAEGDAVAVRDRGGSAGILVTR
ncbi:MAG: hypothetical protein WEC33_06710 [Dehalococcoidia bacterium]